MEHNSQHRRAVQLDDRRSGITGLRGAVDGHLLGDVGQEGVGEDGDGTATDAEVDDIGSGDSVRLLDGRAEGAYDGGPRC